MVCKYVSGPKHLEMDGVAPLWKFVAWNGIVLRIWKRMRMSRRMSGMNDSHFLRVVVICV